VVFFTGIAFGELLLVGFAFKHFTGRFGTQCNWKTRFAHPPRLLMRIQAALARDNGSRVLRKRSCEDISTAQWVPDASQYAAYSTSRIHLVFFMFPLQNK